MRGAALTPPRSRNPAPGKRGLPALQRELQHSMDLPLHRATLSLSLRPLSRIFFSRPGWHISVEGDRRKMAVYAQGGTPTLGWPQADERGETRCFRPLSPQGVHWTPEGAARLLEQCQLPAEEV